MSHVNIVFSGQGSQFVGMGADFYEKDEVSQSLFNRANDLLGYSLSDICFRGPEDTLNLTQHTQVAIFVLSACIFERFKSINATAYAGHSLGEISAYYAAGVLDFESALQVVIKRGELMGEAAKQTTNFIDEFGGSSYPLQADVTKEVDCEMLANSVVETYGGIDILDNNVGIGHPGSVVDEKLEKWEFLGGQRTG